MSPSALSNQSILKDTVFNQKFSATKAVRIALLKITGAAEITRLFMVATGTSTFPVPIQLTDTFIHIANLYGA